MIDVAGRWITPGLVDAHVHFSQTGWADGRPDSLDVRDLYPYAEVEERLEAHAERFFAPTCARATTSVFDVGGYPWTFDLPRRAEARPTPGRARRGCGSPGRCSRPGTSGSTCRPSASSSTWPSAAGCATRSPT